MAGNLQMPNRLMLEFIELYKQHEYLWKMKSAAFANKNLQNEAYHKFAELVQLTFITIVKEFEKPSLWPEGNVIASRSAGPSSISWLGFSFTVRQMSRNLGHIHPQVTFGHHLSYINNYMMLFILFLLSRLVSTL